MKKPARKDPLKNEENGRPLNFCASGRAFTISISVLACLAAAWTVRGQGASEIWGQRYNGSGDDRPAAIAVDKDGAVIVTGSSQGSGTGSDYLTIKYSSAGVPLWTNRYDGPVKGNDYASALAVDLSGNVFVTGTQDAGGGDFEFGTIAYSSGGVPLWTNRYAGGAAAIAVDNGGRVFVTGSSGETSEFATTIAYSGAGMPLWTNRYSISPSSRASVLAIDRSGRVFVAGSSSGSFLTIGYSGNGVLLWANEYRGSLNDFAKAKAIAVDKNSGRIFVTGYSKGDTGVSDFATLAYSGDGAALWTNRYAGPSDGYPTAMGLDQNGNVFVTGYSYGSGRFGYGTVAYSNAGIPLWTNRYTEIDHDATPYAIAVDPKGNVVVAGSGGGSGGADIVLVTYSNVGKVLSTNRYDGPAHGIDSANDIALDSSGNIHVAGESAQDGVPNFDYVTLKYAGVAASSPAVTDTNVVERGFNIVKTHLSSILDAYVFGTGYDVSEITGLIVKTPSGQIINLPTAEGKTSIGDLFTFRAQMDRQYPDGQYEMTVKHSGQSFLTHLNLTGSTYPNPPIIVGFEHGSGTIPGGAGFALRGIL